MCPFDQLLLTCTTDTTDLYWIFRDAQGVSFSRRFGNYMGGSSSFIFSTSEYNISQVSPQNSLPFTSQIQADSVVNGTKISCIIFCNDDVEDSQSATVCVIGSGCGKLIYFNVAFKFPR